MARPVTAYVDPAGLASTALVGKLLLDSSDVDPGAFSADQAAAEIEDV
jgi:hypothetical protein